jgi:hypothetical protein
MLKIVSKLAIAGALVTAMAAAPVAAEARDYHGNNGNWNHGRNNDRHDNNSGRNTAIALGLLGGIIGLAALSSSSSHRETVVVREAPRPVYVVRPHHRYTYAYPAPVYGRYAYGY